jgi:(R,R)-butanediol dehydrogenase/meso-butanediol dehydrogenase/diacetyl reductase
MRAALLYGPRDLRIEDASQPRDPLDQEITIAVRLCGVCGTDAHEYAHGGPMTPLRTPHPSSGHVGPMIVGHEFMGRVVAAGGDSGFAIGQRVVAGAGQWCGQCEACRADRTNLCERYYTFGLNTHGGMAEFVTVPAQMCVAVPDECADADAVLTQPVAIAMHALDRSGLRPGDEALVIGAGGIGALLIAAAADLGVRVNVVDLDQDRLDVAARLGAAATALSEPPGASLGEVAFGGMVTVFETSGSTSGLASALAASARGGRIVGVGLPMRPVEFDIRAAVVAEIDVITSSAHCCGRDLPAAVDLLTRRPLEKEIVGRVVALERLVPDVMEPLVGGGATGKSVIQIAGE